MNILTWLAPVVLCTACTSAGTSNSQSAQFDVRSLSTRDADLAHECDEALDFFALDQSKIPQALRYELALTFQKFDKHCLRFGYKLLGPETTPYNMEHQQKLRDQLRRNGHEGQSFSRTYSGGHRSPPLFYGYQ
jgi:hypothetical protein